MLPVTKKRDISALLDESYTQRGNGQKCWATRVSLEAKPFLEEVEKRCAAGNTPTWTRVAEILEREFDLRMSSTNLSRHFRRGCSCGR